MSVYRSEKEAYLDRAFQSVWTDQTLKPDKIVLIEDGELTSELYFVIDKWQNILNDKLLILKNPENLGLTKSLNKGIQHITNDLIARMDSDDISLPNRFELQHNFMKLHSEISVLGGRLQEFNDENQCLGIRNYPTDSEKIKKYICKASPLAHPSVMMRTSIFNSLKYNDKYKTSQDIALWFDVLEKGFKISNLEEIVLHFRRDSDTLKRRNKSKALNEFKIYMKGIKKLYGIFSFRYIYPIMRLIFRLMPRFFIQKIYNGKIRTAMLNKSQQ
jgi:glycosyltransferase involved in cell wall biosynthesis